MRKAVQDLRASAEPVDRAAVVLLVQEESRLLAVLYIHDIADAVLGDLYFGIEGRREEPLLARQSLELPDLGVTALVDAADLYAVLRQDFYERRKDMSLEAVDAERQRFDNQHVLVLVHREPRQEVRLSEDQAAAGGVYDLFAVLPRVPHALRKERRCDRVLPAARQEPHRDLRSPVDEAVSHEIPVKILHGDDASVLERAFELRDLIVVDPEPAGFDRAPLFLFQDGGAGRGEVLLTVNIVLIDVKR